MTNRPAGRGVYRLFAALTSVAFGEKSFFLGRVIAAVGGFVEMAVAMELGDSTLDVRQKQCQENNHEGVPVEQWRILKLLAEKNGRPMSELTQAALLNHPTLTKMIDRAYADMKERINT